MSAGDKLQLERRKLVAHPGSARRCSARCRRRRARWSGTAFRAPRQAALRPVQAAGIAAASPHGLGEPPAPTAPAPRRLQQSPNCAGPARRLRSSMTGRETTSRLIAAFCDKQRQQADLGYQCLRLQGRLSAHAGRSRERHVRRRRRLAAGKRVSDVGPDTTKSRPVRALTCLAPARSRTTVDGCGHRR